MNDDINRFWIPIAQILPVFILGLVIEARAVLSPSSKKVTKKAVKSGAVGFKGPIEAIDSVLSVLYAIIFVIAMGTLVLAFVLSILVLAGGKVDHSDIGPVLLIAFIGAVLTGLLPVARLLEDLFFDFLAGSIASVRKRRKGKRAATRR